MANQKIIAQKEQKVKDLAEELKNAKLILLVDYRGITVEADTKLRKDLREANGKSIVIKNNIIKRALDLNGDKDLDDKLVGPTAIILADDNYTDVLKIVYKFAKANENYKMKGGYIEGNVQTVEELTTLAQLPSREELLSKLAGSLLQTISKVAIAIDQVRIKKESEGEKVAETVEVKADAEKPAEAPATEEAKADEPKEE